MLPILRFGGIVDDQEWTPYIYAPAPEERKILEDPTGMAYETMYGKDKEKWAGTYAPDDKDETEG